MFLKFNLEGLVPTIELGSRDGKSCACARLCAMPAEGAVLPERAASRDPALDPRGRGRMTSPDPKRPDLAARSQDGRDAVRPLQAGSASIERRQPHPRRVPPRRSHTEPEQAREADPVANRSLTSPAGLPGQTRYFSSQRQSEPTAHFATESVDCSRSSDVFRPRREKSRAIFFRFSAISCASTRLYARSSRPPGPSARSRHVRPRNRQQVARLRRAKNEDRRPDAGRPIGPRTLLRTAATDIDKQTGDPRAVQILLGLRRSRVRGDTSACMSKLL